MITTQLPSGLSDKGAEMYSEDGILMALTGGNAIQVIRSKDIKSKVFRHMVSRPAAHRAIVKWVGSNVDDQINRYGLCVWGSFDMNPDMDEDGQMSDSEFVHCTMRGRCSNENIICKGANCSKSISPAEHRIMPLILFTHKEIAKRLFVSPFTIRAQIKSIKNKLGIQTKAQLVNWAKDNGIALCK